MSIFKLSLIIAWLLILQISVLAIPGFRFSRSLLYLQSSIPTDSAFTGSLNCNSSDENSTTIRSSDSDVKISENNVFIQNEVLRYSLFTIMNSA